MGSRFGIGLLHRHFSMSPTEILVGYGLVSTTWPKPVTASPFMSGRITSKSWLFSDFDPELCPYEFSFSAPADTLVMRLKARYKSMVARI